MASTHFTDAPRTDYTPDEGNHLYAIESLHSLGYSDSFLDSYSTPNPGEGAVYEVPEPSSATNKGVPGPTTYQNVPSLSRASTRELLEEYADPVDDGETPPFLEYESVESVEVRYTWLRGTPKCG